jgi:hypothetical protein
MNQELHLSKDFTISVSDYASQGNAVLGIRDAGKTYTAMKAAESLMDAGVPIIVYDPVGVWKNLKIGAGKNKGYQVVIAGGAGSDIILTTSNAIDIVRAAMKENVNLVIDLYSPELINKSSWISIVQQTVDVLMYENKSYGLRHIFLEEAAEFIPQRLQPQHARVYASIERLARMGRNARLGYTIINQRAEEVNKAILEISNFSLLHKQVGKNSLKSIQQWLELRQLDNAKDIIKTLPTLQQGECWAIGLTDQPKRIQIAERKTFHPNPRKDQGTTNFHSATADVTVFVAKMNEQLEKVKEAKAPKKKSAAASPVANNSQADHFRAVISKLKAEDAEKDRLLTEWKKLAVSRGVLINKLRSLLGTDDIVGPDPKTTHVVKVLPPVQKPIKPVSVNAGDASLGKCSREIICFLAQYADRQFSKGQISVATGYSLKSSGFNNSLSQLNSLGFIIKDGKIQVNQDAMSQIVAAVGEITHQAYNIDLYKKNLGKCEREIYEALLARPDTSYTKEQVAEMTGYSPTSSGFNNSLSRLNSLELIVKQRGQIILNPELLELM